MLSLNVSYLSCTFFICAPESPVFSVKTGLYVLLRDQLTCGCMWRCNSGPYQVWVQKEMGSLQSQTVPKLFCPQCFWLFTVSSRGGPTCAISPLRKLEWVANSVHHLDMAHSGRGWFHARDRNKKPWFWVLTLVNC